MRLLEITKKLRKEFPDIKIRQLQDNLNRIYLLFVIPDNETPLSLILEHDYILLDFATMKSCYDYNDFDFDYMVLELKMFIYEKSCVLSIFNNDDELCGSLMIHSDELDADFLEVEILKVFFAKYHHNNFKNGIMEFTYFDANNDHKIYWQNNRLQVDKRWEIFKLV